MHIDATIERVRAFARSKGWGTYRLAQEAGLSKQACMKMYGQDWSPRADTLRKIEALIPPDFDATDGVSDAAVSLK